MMQEGYEIRRVRSSSPFGPPSGQQPVLVSRFSSPARPSVIDGPTTLHPGQRKSGAILTTCAPRTHEKAQGQRPDGPPIRMRNSQETHAHATSLNIGASGKGRSRRIEPTAASSSRLEPRLPLKYGLGRVCLPPIMRIVRTLSVGRSTKGQSTERSVPSYVSVKVVLYRATSDLATALYTGTSANANELSLLNVLGALHRGDETFAVALASSIAHGKDFRRIKGAPLCLPRAMGVLLGFGARGYSSGHNGSRESLSVRVWPCVCPP
ncbi:hypothetical protein V1478_001210 [Vespula squamosa]|uniref:Uncharacterized protein n=1 Tax=Vespula squamosa TaxID=30214 RepID=A0ABD2C7P1_VESSQ